MSKKNLILNTIIEESIEVLSQENYRLVNEMIRDKNDPKAFADTHTKTIKSYLRHVLHDALNKHSKEKSQKEAYLKTKESYESVKLDLQVKIAEAFEDVYTKFVGKTPDFYCEIKLVPEYENKETTH